MNWLDYTLIIIIATGTIFGILTGPLWQLYRIFSIVIATIAVLLLHKTLSDTLSGIFNPEISNIIGDSIIFIVVLILTYALGNLFKFFLTKRKFGISGRILGGGMGFTKTTLTCCIIISIVSFTGNSRAEKIINNSLIANNLNKVTRSVISKTPKDFKEKSFTKEKVILKKINNSQRE